MYSTITKKAILIVIYIVFIFSIFWNVYNLIGAADKSHSIIIDTKDLSDIINNNSPKDVFLDLRDEKDYESGHISRAINPVYSENCSEIVAYLKTNQYENKNIYLICYSGNRSANAFNVLVKMGFKNVYYVKFGYDTLISEMEGKVSLSKGACNCRDE